MKKLSGFLCAIVLVFGIVGTANSALWDRGGGLIYDDVLDITWMQGADYAAMELTNARCDAIISAVGSVDGHALFEGDFNQDNGEYTGKMTWWGAMAWADQLVYGGHDDWRLPDPHNLDGTGPDYGYGVMFSEMGLMYHYNLGGPVFGGMFDRNFVDGNGDIVSFENLLSEKYWYGLTRPNPAYEQAWVFDFFHGLQKDENKDAISTTYAWAVHDGDIGTVPIPSAVWLLGSGLIGIVGFRKKFRHKPRQTPLPNYLF